MKAANILSKYFNTQDDPPGYQKIPLGDFAKELKALSPEDKKELVTLAAEDLGVEVTK